MERCPNCGQLSRSGARFCTTCGHKIGADSADAAATSAKPANEPSEPATAEAADEQTANGGWPVTSTESQSAPEVDWAAPPSSVTNSEEVTVDEATVEEPPSFWTSGSTATWPSPPVTNAEEPPTNAVSVETETVVETEEESVTVPAAADSEAASARDRAARLLDELREAIAAFNGGAPRDLSGVISELEVAVTPPGALGVEELNELREALLKARDRPRDIDTIVDLTGRLDVMVALIFAYDRTVAAIERSLDVLRGDG